MEALGEVNRGGDAQTLLKQSARQNSSARKHLQEVLRASPAKLAGEVPETGGRQRPRARRAGRKSPRPRARRGPDRRRPGTQSAGTRSRRRAPPRPRRTRRRSCRAGDVVRPSALEDGVRLGARASRKRSANTNADDGDLEGPRSPSAASAFEVASLSTGSRQARVPPEIGDPVRMSSQRQAAPKGRGP